MVFEKMLAFLRFIASESHHCITEALNSGKQFQGCGFFFFFFFSLFFKLQQQNLGDNLGALKTLSPPLTSLYLP